MLVWVIKQTRGRYLNSTIISFLFFTVVMLNVLWLITGKKKFDQRIIFLLRTLLRFDRVYMYVTGRNEAGQDGVRHEEQSSWLHPCRAHWKHQVHPEVSEGDAHLLAGLCHIGPAAPVAQKSLCVFKSASEFACLNFVLSSLPCVCDTCWLKWKVRGNVICAEFFLGN